MISIEFAYLLASSAAVFAMAPQVKKLLVARRSDELSLPSWFVWSLAQVVGLTYSISLHIVPYIIINAIWVFYYAAMVFLIIWFRRPEVVRTQSTANTIDIIEDTSLVGGS